MEWDTSHWYNFAHLRERSKLPVDGKKVFITGSSVALYSVLPEQILKDSLPKIHTQFYSHVALAPTDLYYYKEEIAKAKPNLVIYMLNFADLQWEFVQTQNGILTFDEKAWLNEYATRYPAKTYYPFEFLIDHFANLNKQQALALASKSALYVNRHRSFFFDPLETWIDNHFRSGRSFERYAGSIPREGVWSKGWTHPTTLVKCDLDRKLDDSIFTLTDQTQLRISVFSKANAELNPELNFTKPLFSKIFNFKKRGWNDFPWDEISSHINASEVVLQLEVISKLGTAKEANIFRYGKDYSIGIRLSHYFCAKPTFRDKSYIRESFYDEKRFSEMNVQVYEEDYFLRIQERASERPELGRLNTIKQSKMQVKDLHFTPWFEIEQIVRVSDYFRKKDIPFVIVMSPENPLESQLYVDGLWFKGMLAYLNEELSKNKQKLVDHTRTVTKIQYFFDPHHMTYDGAYSYTPYIQNIILDTLNTNDKP
jgi:hypothetical protein